MPFDSRRTGLFRRARSAWAGLSIASRKGVRVTLKVNGEPRGFEAEPRRTLLDVLRAELGLTGAKRACDMGNCGACTVLLDGRAVYSCLTLAVECGGRSITTVEGLSSGGPGGELDAVQRAFIEADALQCGYCTPGQVMAMRALLNENRNPSDAEIVHAMSGNLCRCGAYAGILRAARMAAQMLQQESAG
jgi:aerobic-type carbon monoxide dehydrogenase small subunit (CoxS/CutS family)